MKVVLAYSGGLDTTVLLTWLQEKYNAEVICYCANVGQEEELDGLEEKALKHGAVKCIVDNIEEEFAKDYIFPMMQANAIYEGTYLLGTSIARPLIAKRMMDIVLEEGAEAICHGATGKGNDQVRFELTAYAIKPDIKIIAPWRMPEDFPFKGRTDMINYLEKRGIPCQVSAKKPYSTDRNLLHISFEGGILEDPWNEADESMWVMTKPLSQAKDEAEYIEISFEKGVPVAVNGEALSPAALMRKLNELGCEHAIGRIDIVENRFTGMKDRGIYETPGGTILQAAHRAMESICMDREVMHLRDSLIPKYATLVYNGFWFAPEREMLQAAVEKSQETVTGDVRLKLFKGAVHTVGRKSDLSLYNPELVSFDEEGGYDQTDATGFIKLNALRLRVRAAMQNK
ncbi:argininosuccinate synthase [Tichowtungia aerotolerans]|uniref:Argininosuccinate synthase n=2 Tax=Tichowtungia aerotolerans TaxID=2697043 RepID=A0A6P1M1X4_9BACT|nr:argininosuccinate synthase [Tichowtungia aerotolerans]QHI68112.1 argininosuccinate synthase [Tichowtungia aerotolerans]